MAFFINTFTQFTQNSFKNIVVEEEGLENSFLLINTFCIFHKWSGVYSASLTFQMGLEIIQNNAVTSDIAMSHLADLIVANFQIYLNFSELPPTSRGSLLHAYEMKSRAISFLPQCKIVSLLTTCAVSAKLSGFALALTQLWIWNVCGTMVKDQTKKKCMSDALPS